MSDAPERIAVWPDFVGHPSMTGQWSANTHPDNAVAYVRADLSDALLREAAEVLDWYAENSRLARLIHSEGDKGRNTIAQDGGKQARATLAKLREHLGETK